LDLHETILQRYSKGPITKKGVVMLASLFLSPLAHRARLWRRANFYKVLKEQQERTVSKAHGLFRVLEKKRFSPNAHWFAAREHVKKRHPKKPTMMAPVPAAKGSVAKGLLPRTTALSAFREVIRNVFCPPVYDPVRPRMFGWPKPRDPEEDLV
jgi:hypothetical protein